MSIQFSSIIAQMTFEQCHSITFYYNSHPKIDENLLKRKFHCVLEHSPILKKMSKHPAEGD